jgi:hypothetical protein
MLSAALATAGRSIFVLGALVCSVHTCEGLASYTLTPTTEGMQLKTPQGKIVFEDKTNIPANLQSRSAAYLYPVNTPSGERVSNAAPDLLSKDINYGRNAGTLDDFDAVFFMSGGSWGNH